MPYLLAAGVGLFVGYVGGKGTAELSSAVKWAAGAGVIYIGAKAFKVI